VIGSGSSTDAFRLQRVKVMEKNDLKWGDNMSNLVLSGAPRNFVFATFLAGHCSHSYLVSSSESVIQLFKELLLVKWASIL